MSARRLAALLSGIVLLLAAACGPAAAFIAWATAKIDAEPAGTDLRWLLITLLVSGGLVVVGSLLLRFYVRSGRPVESAVIARQEDT